MDEEKQHKTRFCERCNSVQKVGSHNQCLACRKRIYKEKCDAKKAKNTEPSPVTIYENWKRQYSQETLVAAAQLVLAAARPPVPEKAPATVVKPPAPLVAAPAVKKPAVASESSDSDMCECKCGRTVEDGFEACCVYCDRGQGHTEDCDDSWAIATAFDD
jgi:hypothetical protein